MWKQKHNRDKLRHLRAERRGVDVVRAQFLDEAADTEHIFMDKTLKRLLVVRNLCDQLGIPNSCTRATIPRDMVEKVVIPQNIERNMGLPYSRSKEERSELQRKVTILRRVFEKWSGTTFEMGKSQRATVNGVRMYITPVETIPELPGMWEGVPE